MRTLTLEGDKYGIGLSFDSKFRFRDGSATANIVGRLHLGGKWRR